MQKPGKPKAFFTSM